MLAKRKKFKLLAFIVVITFILTAAIDLIVFDRMFNYIGSAWAEAFTSDLQKNLIAYYDMEIQDDGKIHPDSANGYTLSKKSGKFLSEITDDDDGKTIESTENAIYGKAVNFGEGSFLQFDGNGVGLQSGATGVTFSMWINNIYSDYNGLIQFVKSSGSPSDNNPDRLGRLINAGNLGYTNNWGSTVDGITSISMMGMEFVHLVISIDKTKGLYIYKNGWEAKRYATADDISNYVSFMVDRCVDGVVGLRMGHENGGQDRPNDTIIDEVRVFNKSVSANEATSLYYYDLSFREYASIDDVTKNLIASYDMEYKDTMNPTIGNLNMTAVLDGNQERIGSVPGAVGNASYFGQGSYYAFPNGSGVGLPDTATGITFSMWLNGIIEEYNGLLQFSNNTDNNHGEVHGINAGNISRVRSSEGDGAFLAFWPNDNDNSVKSKALFASNNNNQFVHVTFVISSDGVTVYKNGAFLSNFNGASEKLCASYIIQNSKNGNVGLRWGNQPTDGYADRRKGMIIDELQIYGSAVSANEAAAIYEYNQSLRNGATLSDSLIASYNMELNGDNVYPNQGNLPLSKQGGLKSVSGVVGNGIEFEKGGYFNFPDGKGVGLPSSSNSVTFSLWIKDVYNQWNGILRFRNSGDDKAINLASGNMHTLPWNSTFDTGGGGDYSYDYAIYFGNLNNGYGGFPSDFTLFNGDSNINNGYVNITYVITADVGIKIYKNGSFIYEYTGCNHAGRNTGHDHEGDNLAKKYATFIVNKCKDGRVGLRFGNNDSDSDRPAGVKMDEFRIFSRALTDNEISQLYESNESDTRNTANNTINSKRDTANNLLFKDAYTKDTFMPLQKAIKEANYSRDGLTVEQLILRSTALDKAMDNLVKLSTWRADTFKSDNPIVNLNTADFDYGSHNSQIYDALDEYNSIKNDETLAFLTSEKANLNALYDLTKQAEAASFVSPYSELLALNDGVNFLIPYKSDVQSAITAFDSFAANNPDAYQYVDNNYTTLTTLRTTITTREANIKNFNNTAILQLGLGDLTLNNYGHLLSAKTAYEALNYEEITHVTAKKATLDEMLEFIEDTTAVIDQINNLANLTIDEIDDVATAKTAISNANTAYDGLSGLQKALVTQTVLNVIDATWQKVITVFVNDFKNTHSEALALTIDTVTSSDYSKVYNAIDAYYALVDQDAKDALSEELGLLNALFFEAEVLLYLDKFEDGLEEYIGEEAFYYGIETDNATINDVISIIETIFNDRELTLAEENNPKPSIVEVYRRLETEFERLDTLKTKLEYLDEAYDAAQVFIGLYSDEIELKLSDFTTYTQLKAWENDSGKVLGEALVAYDTLITQYSSVNLYLILTEEKDKLDYLDEVITDTDTFLALSILGFTASNIQRSDIYDDIYDDIDNTLTVLEGLDTYTLIGGDNIKAQLNALEELLTEVDTYLYDYKDILEKTTADMSIGYEDDIDEALGYYNEELSGLAKILLTTEKDHLVDLFDKVTALIFLDNHDEILTKISYSIDDIDALENAEDDYSDLSLAQKAYSGIAEDFFDLITTLKNAKEVFDLINAIVYDDLTFEDTSASTARSKFVDLETEEKDYVTNIATLEAAEQRVLELIANEVARLLYISENPIVNFDLVNDTLQISDEDAVLDAIEAYEDLDNDEVSASLSQEHQKLVEMLAIIKGLRADKFKDTDYVYELALNERFTNPNDALLVETMYTAYTTMTDIAVKDLLIADIGELIETLHLRALDVLEAEAFRVKYEDELKIASDEDILTYSDEIEACYDEFIAITNEDILELLEVEGEKISALFTRLAVLVLSQKFLDDFDDTINLNIGLANLLDYKDDIEEALTELGRLINISTEIETLLSVEKAKLDDLSQRVTDLKNIISFRSTYEDLYETDILDIKIGDRGDVEAVLAVYAGYGDYAKAQLGEEKGKLDALLLRIENLEDAEEFKETHKAVLALNNTSVLPADYNRINATLTAYGQLKDTKPAVAALLEEVVYDYLTDLLVVVEIKTKAKNYTDTYSDIISKTVSTIALSNLERLDLAYAAYGELDEEVSDFLDLDEFFERLYERISSLQVENAMQKINLITTLTLENIALYTEAKNTYNALTESQKAIVSNSIKTKLGELDAAYDFIQTYNGILTKEIGIDDKATVRQAMEDYKTNSGKNYLISISVYLNTLEAEIFALEAEDFKLTYRDILMLKPTNLTLNFVDNYMDENGISFDDALNAVIAVYNGLEDGITAWLTKEHDDLSALSAQMMIVNDAFSFKDSANDILGLTNETVEITDDKAIAKVIKDIYDLDADIRGLLQNEFNHLVALQTRILELIEEAANDYKEKYEELLLKTKEELTMDDRQTLEAAINDFDDLLDVIKDELLDEELILIDFKTRLEVLIESDDFRIKYSDILSLTIDSPNLLDWKDKIMEAKVYFDKLSDEAMSLLEMEIGIINDLILEISKIEYINGVYALVIALPFANSVTLDDKDAFNNAKEKFNLLPVDKQLTEFVNKLKDIETMLNVLQENKEILDLLKYLEETNLTTKDREVLTEVLGKLENMSEEQRDLIEENGHVTSLLNSLEEAETIIDELEIVEIETIINNSIPRRLSVNDKSQIEEILNAFNNLSESQQDRVANYAKLTSAITEISKLEVKEVEKIIEKLPSSLSSDNMEEVELALLAFSNLSSSQQTSITNYESLVLAQENLESFRIALSFKSNYSQILDKSVNSVDLSDKVSIELILSEINNQSDGVKKYLSEDEEKLKSMLKRIEILEDGSIGTFGIALIVSIVISNIIILLFFLTNYKRIRKDNKKQEPYPYAY